jgi:divalent metal cation (Fe/Co/Zn/Cd) transporter
MEAVERIANPDSLLRPGFLALSGAMISIVVNEWMYWYNVRVARELHSDLMRANAWHHRSDAVSSIIVMIGVAGSMAGYPLLDAVGAIGVSALIGKIGWDLGWSGLRELVDTGAAPEQLEEIADIIRAVDGVESFHDLRTRRMGRQFLVEVHVLVGSQVTVSEGHMIGDKVHSALLSGHEYISEVLIHVDPEDDAADRVNTLLPGREEMLHRLAKCWREEGIDVPVERVNFHYLKGLIDLEIVVPLDQFEDLDAARRVSRQLVEATKAQDSIGKVEVLFR